jgi:hypothetical protein
MDVIEIRCESVSVNLLNKKSRTTDKRLSSNFWV